MRALFAVAVCCCWSWPAAVQRLERIGRRGMKGDLFLGGAAPATTCPKEKGYACRLNKIDYVDSHNG